MKKFLTWCALLTLALLGLVACGDDDGGDGDSGNGDATEETDGGDETDEGGEELSEEEYLEAGDELCAGTDEQAEEAVDDLDADFSDGELTEEEQTELAVEVLLPIVRDTVEAFRALEGPEDLTEDVDEILDEIEARADQLEDDPSLALDEEPFGDIDEQWSDLGFEECGSDA